MSNSLENIFTISASGMSAQSIRLNTIASNLANAGNVGSTEDSTYHSKYPIFSEVTTPIPGLSENEQPINGVRVTSVEQTNKPLQTRYDPTNPQAGEDGYIYMTDVNSIEQMTNMIDASKAYQANVEVMGTAKNLALQSLNVINSK